MLVWLKPEFHFLAPLSPPPFAIGHFCHRFHRRFLAADTQKICVGPDHVSTSAQLVGRVSRHTTAGLANSVTSTPRLSHLSDICFCTDICYFLLLYFPLSPACKYYFFSNSSAKAAPHNPSLGLSPLNLLSCNDVRIEAQWKARKI